MTINMFISRGNGSSEKKKRFWDVFLSNLIKNDNLAYTLDQSSNMDHNLVSSKIYKATHINKLNVQNIESIILWGFFCH